MGTVHICIITDVLQPEPHRTWWEMSTSVTLFLCITTDILQPNSLSFYLVGLFIFVSLPMSCSKHVTAPSPSPFSVTPNFESLILLAINRMPRGKAIGVDGIHTEMLQIHPELCAKLLSTMWSTVGRLQVYPTQWSRGTLIPIHKNQGSESEPANFRPVCLLSHMRKAIETALAIQITQEFTPHPTQFGFRTDQSIDSALLLAEYAMKSGSHAGILDLRKAYDSVDRQFLLQRCTQVLSPNTTGMIQSSLGKVILHTIGDVSNTYGVSTIGVVQESSCSPPLFNIFIDPLAEELHKTALTLPDNPKNALLADDVAVYAKIASSMQALLDVCSTWAHQYNMSWNARKSHILISNHTPFANNSFTLNDEILPITTSVKYLGVTLSGKGIGAKKSIQRTESARSALRRLIDSGILSPVLKPQRVSQIFTTFVRSKYVYALAHIPLSQQLLEKDDELVDMLYRSLLRLRTLPTKKQRKLLNGFYRLRSLQLIKEEASNSLARKILDRSMSENALTRTLAERDKSIINTRDSYNKLYRALLNPLNPKQVQHRRFVQWNYARHDLRRKPAPFTPEKWPLATIIGQNNPTLRLMAMRWHLGTFPLNIDQDPLSDDRQHFLILHSMFKTPNKEISTRHIQAVEDSITHFPNQHNQ